MIVSGSDRRRAGDARCGAAHRRRARAIWIAPRGGIRERRARGFAGREVSSRHRSHRRVGGVPAREPEMTDMPRYPWLAHYDPGVPASLAPYPERTLLDYLGETARAHPTHPMLFFKGRAMTTAEVERLSDAFAAALVEMGVATGDRVGICLPNCPQFFIAELGAWKAGAVACPFNPTYTEREMEDAIHASGAVVLITLNRFYESLRTIRPRTSVRRIVATGIKDFLPPLLRIAYGLLRERREGERVRLQDGDARMTDLLRRHHDAPRPDVAVLPEDHATILMSGGTTGSPKGVVGTHRAMVEAGLQLQAWLRPAMEPWTDTILLPLPLFHTYANTGVQSLAVINHNPLSLVPNPRDIKDLLNTINAVQPAFMVAVPTLLSAIMNHPMTRAGKVRFSSIKLCFSGAAALLAETKRRFEEMTGGVIVEGYSLTEAQMAVVANPVRGEKKVGSVGMPLPDVEVRIIDPDDGTTPMAQGDVGEIVMRAPQLMVGYQDRPDETREMLRTDDRGDLVLHTGDLGYLDPDGYLFIVDRMKDVIKPSGFQVWPREVEEVIATHPAVAEVGVAGLPDPVKGERVKAWVILRPGATATEADLKAFGHEHLAHYKVPSTFEIVTELPKSQVGKVLRRVLREREMAKMSA
jgi:long-chain acyl-CoA synthetase